MSSPQKDREIESYIDGEIRRRTQAQDLDEESLKYIRDALVAYAQGMYLWVVLQIDALFPLYSESVTTLGDLSHFLTRLPAGLFNSFEQALGKITDQKYGSRIFQLVAAAKRPLMKNELRVALNIQPGVPVWDSCTLARDPEALIYRCGGGLLEIDEEDDTVHFIHHSALQHLLTDVQTDHSDVRTEEDDKDEVEDEGALACSSPLAFRRAPNGNAKHPRNHRHKSYLFNANQADVSMGYICITALNFEHHDRRISRPQKMVVNEGALQMISTATTQNSVLARLMMTALQRKGPYQNPTEFNIIRTIENLSRVKPSVDPNETQLFSGYAEAYWLSHTSQPCHDPKDEAVFHTLFVKLIRENAPGLCFPWGEDTGDSKTIMWAKDNRHLRLLYDLLHHTTALDLRGIVQSLSTVPDSQLLGLACHNKTLEDVLCRFVDIDCLDKIGVETLLKLGARPNQAYRYRTMEGISPLQLAIKRMSDQSTYSIDVVRRLLEAGAHSRGSASARPPILLAIDANWAEGYQLLFSHGERVFAVRNEEFNPLLALDLAIFCEPAADKMIEDLVASGAMIENYFKNAWWPVETRVRLDYSGSKKSLSTFDGEETGWVDVNRVDVVCPWLWLRGFLSPEESSRANRRVLEWLLKAKFGPRLTSKNGMTPLGLAVESSATHLARKILKAGADVHQIYRDAGRDFSDPQLPLLTAARKGSIEMVYLLLANGASVMDNIHGNTILAMALHEEIELGKKSDWLLSGGREKSAWLLSRFGIIAQVLDGYSMELDETVVASPSLLMTITRAFSKEYRSCMIENLQDPRKDFRMGVRHFTRTGRVDYTRDKNMDDGDAEWSYEGLMKEIAV